MVGLFGHASWRSERGHGDEGSDYSGTGPGATVYDCGIRSENACVHLFWRRRNVSDRQWVFETLQRH